MAREVRVLAIHKTLNGRSSDFSVLLEAAGDTAITVDPYSVEAIASALKEVINNKKLRDKLVKKGFGRVKLFNWKEVAEKTIETYRNVFTDGIR